MFDSGECCKEKWDVSLFGVKGLNFPQIFYNNFTVQECKVLFCYPLFSGLPQKLWDTRYIEEVRRPHGTSYWGAKCGDIINLCKLEAMLSREKLKYIVLFFGVWNHCTFVVYLDGKQKPNLILMWVRFNVTWFVHSHQGPRVN